MPDKINEQLNIADTTGKNKAGDRENSSLKLEVSSASSELPETTNQLNDLYTNIASDKGIDVETLNKIREQILKMQKIEAESPLPSQIAEQIKTAEEIMGEENVLGIDAIEATFDFKPLPREIPNIPFSRVELIRAKELHQFLVLRVNKDKDGKPLTMEKMNELKGGKTKDESKILYSADDKGKLKDDTWYKAEDFFSKEAPTLGWALVSKEVIPNSTSQNYLDQTETLVDYLKNQVFKGQKLDKAYQEAIAEFNKEKDSIKKLMDSDWKTAAEKLEKLKINNLCRQTPADALYDILLMKEKNDEYILSDKYTWTNRRDSGGKLVSVGDAASDGVGVNSDLPDNSHANLGVAFSRTK